MTLPTGFETLAPFVETWTAENSAKRDALRCHQSADARQAFYDAMTPLVGSALDLLDATPLADHDAGQKSLMLLALSYAHVALAVEVQGPDEARHSISRQRVPIAFSPSESPASPTQRP